MTTPKRWWLLGVTIFSTTLCGGVFAAPVQQDSIAVGYYPMGMAVAGHRLVVALATGSVAVVDTRSNQTLASHPVGPRPVDATIAGRRIYVLHHAQQSGHRGRLSVLAIDDGRIVKAADVGRGPVGLAVDPTNDLVYTVDFKSQSVSVLDRHSLELVGRVRRTQWRGPNHGYPTDVDVDSDTGFAFVSTTDGYVDQLKGDHVVNTVRAQKAFGDTALEVDSSHDDVYMTNAVDGRVTRLHRSGRHFRVAETWNIDDLQAERAAVAPGRGLVAVMGIPVPDDETAAEVVILRRRTGEEIGRTRVGFGAWDMQRAPDGWHFYVSDALGDAVAIVAADGKPPKSTLDLSSPAVLDDGDPLSGKSEDDWSGLASLTVYFEGPATAWSAKASLHCYEQRRRCEWAVSAPQEPGVYSVRVEARDKAQNVESAGEERVVTWLP